MKNLNRRKALLQISHSSIASQALISTTKWATPAVLLQTLPSHAQSSETPTMVSSSPIYSQCQLGFGLAALGNQLFQYTANSDVSIRNFGLAVINNFNLTASTLVNTTIELTFSRDGKTVFSTTENISNTLTVGNTQDITVNVRDSFVIDVGTTSQIIEFDVVTTITHDVTDERFGRIEQGVLNDTLILNNTVTGNLNNDIFFTGSFAENICQ